MLSRLKTLFLSLSFACVGSIYAQTNLVINEIQVGNIDEFIDPSYNYGGWIELYNTSNAAITLSGMYISDDPTNLKKYRFSSSHGSVPANGFKTIWFDHNSLDGTYGTGATTQVRFKLNAEGGTVYISDNNGNKLIELAYPQAISRCSYARITDGAQTWRWTGAPTQGRSNNGSVFADEQVADPVISHDSGIVNSAITVSAEIPAGVTIKYTVDGQTPTASVGQTLTNAGISVSSTKVLRFRAFKQGYLPSGVVTRSYIFRDKNWTLPIVSVSTNSKNLYDNTIGVYTVGTNGTTGRGQNSKTNKNMDWERPVNFEYITPDGVCQLNQEATFYVSGGWSRHSNPTSFKLKAEKRYDLQNYLQYDFFDQKPFTRNKCILLRNGGNDVGCRTKDATIQYIIQSSGVYVDGQSYNPCHVFLNGKYHALLNMREPSNKFYAYANYGYDTDFVDAFELSPDAGGQVLKAGTTTAWTRLLSLANKATDATSYNEIVNDLLDIDEYTNYMAAQTWLGCWDWLTNNNNTKWFRSTDPTTGNGRFHFVMFDLDSAFDNGNMLGSLKSSSSNNVTTLFNRIAKSADFKKRFITAFCLMDGSVFTADRAKAAANYIGNLVATPLSFDNQSPWGSCNEVSNAMSSTSNHSGRINSLKNYFSITGGMKVKLNANIEEAQLMVNDQPVPTNKFDGTLFAPVTITASAPAGYNFVGWRMGGGASSTTLMSKGSSWYYYDKGSLDGTDWKTGSTADWGFAKSPLGYGSQSFSTTINYGNNSSNKYPTYYFRRNISFQTKPGKDDVIIMNYTVDDGCVVYVNGVEAGRHLMPAGNISYNTWATSWCEGNPDSDTMILDSSLFNQGQNVIAVEVHNNSGSSSDIYWDAEILMEKNDGEVSSTDREITLTKDQTTTLTAVFEPLPEECLLAAGSSPIVINEVSAGNSIFMNELYKRNDWIELYNTTDKNIDLSGMYLSDNENNPHKYQLGVLPSENGIPGNIIKAHGYKIIWADKLDPLYQFHASFKLGNADGEMVMITAADDSWSNKLTYQAHAGDESFGRYPDGGKRTYKMTRPTIASANQLTSYSILVDGEDVNFDVESFLAGIDSPKADVGTSISGVYDLQGRRLGNNLDDVKQMLAPGIYIVNGKKTVIK